MSKLEKLIQELCPNGVEYKTINEVCENIFAGGTPSTNVAEYYGGNIPWLRSGEIDFNEIIGTEKFITSKGLDSSSARWIKEKSVLIAMTGATVARSGVNLIPLTANQSVCAMEVSSQINYKFLYYTLAKNYNKIKGMAQGALTSINLSIVKSIEIPVPPLPVQEEIARILDDFTELQAELQAELQKRLQQYNYYRDKLLTFEKPDRGGQISDIQWVKLGDICNVITGGEAPTNVSKCISGNNIYPIFANGKDVYGYTDSYVINHDAPCISSIGANTGMVYYHHANFTPIIRLKVVIPTKPNVLISKYLFYFLQTINFKPKNNGGIPNINANDVKKIIIPLPPLTEQQRIVDILDRFEALTTDLQNGLPAEIEARKKQYEYYRNKLLTFKRAN